MEGLLESAVTLGLFLRISSKWGGAVSLQHCGVGLFCSGFSIVTSTILCPSHSSVMPILYAPYTGVEKREEMELCMSRVVFVIFLCSLYCVTKTVLCCYALGI